MDANTRLVRLRGIIADGPTEAVWWRLCAALESWPLNDPARQVALDYAQHHLADWPDRLRQAPLRWEAGQGAWPIVRAVDLSRCRLGDDGLQRLLASGALGAVTHLNLSDNGLTGLSAAALAGCADLGAVRHLDLSHNRLETRGAVTLSRPRSFDRLEHLDLTDNVLGPDAVAAILSGPMQSTLVELALAHNPIGAGGVRALTAAAPPALATLDLRRCKLGAAGLAALGLETGRLDKLLRLRLGETEVHDGDLDPLANLSDRLAHLDLTSMPLSPTTLRGLFVGRSWRSLRTLGLSGCRLDDTALRTLAASASMPGLCELDLSHNELAAEGLAALARAPWSATLEALDLSSNPPGLGASALHCTDLPDLQRLALRMVGLDAAGLERFLRGAAPPRFQRLDLANNGLDAAAADVLVASLGGADALLLGGNKLAADGLRRLLGAPWAGRLTELDVSANQIVGEAFARDLTLELPALERIELACNRVGNRGMVMLASQRLPCLRELGLRFNRLAGVGEDPFWNAFAEVPLESLDLSDNVLGDEGLRRLVRCNHLGALRRLALRNVGLTDQGLRRLLDAERLPALEVLDVANNDVGVRGMRQIANRRATPRLDRVNLEGNRMLGTLLAHITRFRSWHMAVGVRY